MKYFTSPLMAQALVTVANAAAGGIQGCTFEKRCNSLSTELLNIANGEVLFTQIVNSGQNLTLPDNDVSCTQPSVITPKEVCRVALRVATSEKSSTNIEVWLPSDWNGRFAGTGNGGLNGCIAYHDLAYTTSLGFASAGTNNGHNGSSGAPFLDNIEVVTDFAWRSMHTGVTVGKQVTASFYGRNHTKSYYLGCSTGGRQGLKSAQSFPEDFDGIVAGAPALAFNALSLWAGHFLNITGVPGDATFVPRDLWTTIIHDDIMNQCDKLDGYKDGIIELASICDYQPDGLLCRPGQNASTCLTSEQVETVRRVYAPILSPEGNLIYPRLQPGAEPNGVQDVFFTGKPFILAADWFMYAVLNDPNWDPATLTYADYELGARLNPGDIQTFNGDLSPFMSRGGKLLHYHGQEDPIITSAASPWYYEHVSQTMGLQPSELDSFYRFFPIGGMSHCTGGPGATYIGQSATSNAGLDPDQNVLMAMVRWVETGVAPDTILGTAVVPGSTPVDGGPGQFAFQRRHCHYPLRTVYGGSGDPTIADSWKCVE